MNAKQQPMARQRVINRLFTNKLEPKRCDSNESVEHLETTPMVLFSVETINNEDIEQEGRFFSQMGMAKVDKFGIESFKDFQKFFNSNDNDINNLLGSPNDDEEEYTAKTLREKKSIVEYDCPPSPDKSDKMQKYRPQLTEESSIRKNDILNRQKIQTNVNLIRNISGKVLGNLFNTDRMESG